MDTPAASGLPLAFHGTVIHSLTPTTVEILHDCFLLVNAEGKIQLLLPETDRSRISAIVAENGYAPDVFPVKYLARGQFLCPGFVDTHNHAPQWAQRGVGRGRNLLDWLDTVTFPHEAKFADREYAQTMYAQCVAGFLQQGITTAAYYGSRHGEASSILAQTCLEKGQRALVGRCNMNRHAPEWYCDGSAEESLAETREFVEGVHRLDPEGDLVTPVLTPRFAISCDEGVLAGLGQLAAQYDNLPIQTHFNEARDEMEFTKQLFPGFASETALYERFGLLNSRSILAHSIFVDEAEMARLETLQCGIAHCPIANTTIGGFMVAPVREYLRRGIKVGLGTDSGGGYSSSMLEVMKQAFIVSNARQLFTKGADEPLCLYEGFFLATLGGAQVCGLDGKIGNFAVGKEFDALEIHTGEGVRGVMSPVEDEDSIEVIFEKFLMTGDDRNIAKVYVRGRSVKDC
ncbi:hypothetical protein ASPZODRAFT_18716 [Penicilliopsis zonata CBS 506.65]|uniref:Probable guanine deaminase n=1 Tax=Penicilliopsis zonata CBS 506.65 TaxID=1073090 RepID=A0A1L9SA01_9EURO|nr:hypothetical protein ASPZODRAFT_18716 [Penicilliopsis zonata CBS 506.65]OJJ43937.1 hypothetical protein ASPZODRAFT_18716 [Penicilliopsis zonata CBS 506.65]